MNLQAILFQNGRALGRLMSPELRVTPIPEAVPPAPDPADGNAASRYSGEADGEASGSKACKGASCEGGRSSKAVAGEAQRDSAGTAACHVDTLLEVHQLVFDRWQPVWTDFKHSSRTVVLNIPVNASWRAADYRLQVGCHVLVSTCRHCQPFSHQIGDRLLHLC